MREIKFRLWDEFNKYMDYEFYGMGGQGDYCVDINDFLKEHSEFLMQYTGLTDKNGREIYEGDIVSTDLSRPFLIVEFRNGAFAYQCHDNGNDYYDTMAKIDSIVIDKCCYHEVIGNIYENPELLEGNQ